jgi:hypothetical protein
MARQVWDDLLDATQLPGTYTSLGSYPDEEISKLVNAASSALNVPPARCAALVRPRSHAIAGGPLSRFLHPASHAALPFIISVNDIIHPEVRKLYTGGGLSALSVFNGAGRRAADRLQFAAKTVRPGPWFHRRRQVITTVRP